MVTQGHGEHPAAASRRKTLGKKYRTKKPLLARLRPLETPYMPVVSYVSPGSKQWQAKRRYTNATSLISWARSCSVADVHGAGEAASVGA